jgi:chemotaxis protein MotB
VKKRKSEPHVNHERWIISYADFVTLMFALFVAMYAISMKDHNSGKRMSESVKKAVATGGLTGTVKTMLEKTPAPEPEPAPPDTKTAPTAHQSVDPSLLEPYKQLSRDLDAQIKTGAVRLHLETRGLVITLEEKAFFASGDDTVYEQAYASVEQVAKTISKLRNPVRLEGHTDAVPIHTARFKNNWELSTARSIALLQLFEEKYGLDANRFAVAGYAQNLPVASNDSEEGRARNRRVEIVILGWQDSPKDFAAGQNP